MDFNDRILFLDVETTGLVPGKDRIIELGIVETIDHELTHHNLQLYFNPGIESHPDALAVHGITTAFLQDKPSFASCIEDILAFILGAHTLIMHNANFDAMFLSFELTRAGYHSLPLYCRCIKDSLSFSRELHAGPHKLDALCKRYGVALESRQEHHGALVDALLLAQMFRLMVAAHATHPLVQDYLEDNAWPQMLRTTPQRPPCQEYRSSAAAFATHQQMLMFLDVVPELNTVRKENEDNQYLFFDTRED
jgi:DNA polymerase III epsilon subunit